jgi:TonB family protein
MRRDAVERGGGRERADECGDRQQLEGQRPSQPIADHNGRGRRQRAAARDADQRRISQWVAKQPLHDGAGDSQKRANHAGNCDARQPDRPQHQPIARDQVGQNAVASLVNYDGLVSAHLRRQQSAARSGGATGSGAVTFSITVRGSVTSVRLAKSTGAAVLDQEILAMVRRASPFPAPPDGQPKSFTVPLNFTAR